MDDIKTERARCLACVYSHDDLAFADLLVDDEQLFALHTLPWIVHDLTARTLYCDAVYS